MGKERIRRSIRSKINDLICNLTTAELEFLLDENYMQSPDVLLYMELTLRPITSKMRERCKKWDHKIDFTNVMYPTLTRLVRYRHIYENWDGQEPFPSRKTMPLEYYMD